MRILVLAETIDANRTSSGLCSAKIIMALSQLGEVKVVTTTAHDSCISKQPRIQYKVLQQCTYSLLDRFLLKIPMANGLRKLLTGFNVNDLSLLRTWSAFLSSENLNSYEIIVTLGGGMVFSCSYAMIPFAGNIKGKWVAFIHDPFPGQCYPFPYAKPRSLIGYREKNCFQKMLSAATVISFPSLRLKEWMSRFYFGLEEKSIIQPHLGYETEDLLWLESDPPVDNQPNHLLVRDGCFNLLHSGTLLGPRDPSFLFAAFQKLLDDHPDAENKAFLHIVGRLTPEHMKIVSEKKGNIFVHDKRYSYLESLRLQKASQVLVILEAVTDDSPFMPAKLADYAMAGKPILALTPSTSETSRLLSEISETVPNGETDRIYCALKSLYLEWLNNIPFKEGDTRLREYVSEKQWLKTLLNAIN
ncbi:hypothetical protein OAF99_01695 [Akkermansiaceae bacterium]|nr:hypothetical protein [Akkermansiaceae bacterium]